MRSGCDNGGDGGERGGGRGGQGKEVGMVEWGLYLRIDVEDRGGGEVWVDSKQSTIKHLPAYNRKLHSARRALEMHVHHSSAQRTNLCASPIKLSLRPQQQCQQRQESGNRHGDK